MQFFFPDDFRPASVDSTKIATLDVSSNNQVTVTVPHLGKSTHIIPNSNYILINSSLFPKINVYSDIKTKINFIVSMEVC